MRKLFLATVVLVGFLIAYYQIIHLQTKNDSVIEKIEELQMQESLLDNSTLKIIETLNKQKSSIKTIQNVNVPIKLYQNSVKFNAKASIYYEKPNFLNMEVWHSFTGKELELGSNSEFFWFYSKRMDPPSLYYAKHTESHLTNLKAPLHPEWMMHSFNIDCIDVKKIYKVLKCDHTICLMQNAPDSIGQNLIIKTIINEQTGQIAAKALCEKEGKVLCETIYNESNVEIIWKQENIRMILDMSKNILNKSISVDLWKFPNYRYKINMAET